MDLKHLRTFVAVAELGTVSKAAQRLRIAQPALSRQIIALENELGLTLFDRVGGRLLLTGEGERLLGSCRRLLGYATSFTDEARELRSGDSGILKVTASPRMIETVFPTFVHLYAERYPNVQVRVSEGSGLEILGMVERGDVHLGQMLPYGVPLQDAQFGSQPLEPAELLAACHPSMPLGTRGMIEVGRLGAYPLLLRRRKSNPPRPLRRRRRRGSRASGCNLPRRRRRQECSNGCGSCAIFTKSAQVRELDDLDPVPPHGPHDAHQAFEGDRFSYERVDT